MSASASAAAARCAARRRRSRPRGGDRPSPSRGTSRSSRSRRGRTRSRRTRPGRARRAVGCAGRPSASRERIPRREGRLARLREASGPVGEHEARRIPELVGEVPPAVELACVRRWSMPGARPVTSAKRSASAPISSISSSGSTTLPLVLLIFAAVRVADHPVQVDGVERLAVGQEEAEHHHPRHPEEEDVVPGLHDAGRVEARAGRGSRPASRGSRTATGRSRTRCRRCRSPGAAPPPGGRSPRRLGSIGRVADGDVAVGAVPGRDAVAPPQLATDRPVVDVLHPVGVDLLEVRRHDPRPPLADRASARSASGLTSMNHWTDRRGSTTVPQRSQRPTAICVRALRLEVAAARRRRSTIRRARLEAVEAGELAARLVDARRARRGR